MREALKEQIELWDADIEAEIVMSVQNVMSSSLPNELITYCRGPVGFYKKENNNWYYYNPNIDVGWSPLKITNTDKEDWHILLVEHDTKLVKANCDKASFFYKYKSKAIYSIMKECSYYQSYLYCDNKWLKDDRFISREELVNYSVKQGWHKVESLEQLELLKLYSF